MFPGQTRDQYACCRMEVSLSSPRRFHDGCNTYKKEPNIILVIDKCFGGVGLAKNPRFIRSIRFTTGTEASSLIVDDLAGL